MNRHCYLITKEWRSLITNICNFFIFPKEIALTRGWPQKIQSFLIRQVLVWIFINLSLPRSMYLRIEFEEFRRFFVHQWLSFVLKFEKHFQLEIHRNERGVYFKLFIIANGSLMYDRILFLAIHRSCFQLCWRLIYFAGIFIPFSLNKE